LTLKGFDVQQNCNVNEVTSGISCQNFALELSRHNKSSGSRDIVDKLVRLEKVLFRISNPETNHARKMAESSAQCPWYTRMHGTSKLTWHQVAGQTYLMFNPGIEASK
jgi:hypothetical protein